MFPDKITDEQKFGFWITGGVHVVLLIIAMLIYVGGYEQPRSSFVEVELGNYSQGKPAEYAPKKNPKVATRPKPSKVEPKKPVPHQPKRIVPKKKSGTKAEKAVNLPKQVEKVKEPPVKTPKTNKVNPEKQQAKSQKKASIPPKTQKGETIHTGAKTSGDVTGTKGDVKADQGTGNSEKKSAPYSLSWDGSIDRTPIVQPLPKYTVDVEAVITVRFEVEPDGSVGRMIPVKKMNPELEQEVFKTLRSWRFSPLPSGVPQQPQWGTITFRFVLE